LKFAASGSEGTDQEISDCTGIPVGKSDGKVPAIVSYSSGMGLVRVTPGTYKSSRKISVTEFGRSVLLEDTFLSEPLSQWIAHLHLCRRFGGAETWFQVFADGFEILGSRFSENQVENYLASRLGGRNRSLTGPLLRTYSEPAAFGNSQILIGSVDSFSRNAAPLLPCFRLAYSAFFLSLWEDFFPKERQITLSDFESKTYWARSHGWRERDLKKALTMIKETGAISLDTHIWPYALLKLQSQAHYWRLIYDEMP